MTTYRATSLISAYGLDGDLSRYYTDESRERGIAAHMALESVLCHDSVSLAPKYAGYETAARAFVQGTSVHPIFVEMRLTVGGITGKPDVVGWMPNGVGQAVIIDAKTSHPAPWHGVQLAMYEILVEQTQGVREKLPAHLRADRWHRYGLYLKSNGRYAIEPYEDHRDFTIARALIDLTLWRAEHGVCDIEEATGHLDGDDPFGAEAA